MDPRQQRQSHAQRPPYPQVTRQQASSSATSSVFQSTSSLASLSSVNSSARPQASHMAAESAPLPSPSMTQPNNYFNSISSSQAPTSFPSQSQRMPTQQAVASPYIGQRGQGGGAPETATFLQDFNLLAEAAKRAQMACLSRDMGDVGL